MILWYDIELRRPQHRTLFPGIPVYEYAQYHSQPERNSCGRYKTRQHEAFEDITIRLWGCQELFNSLGRAAKYIEDQSIHHFLQLFVIPAL